MINITLALAIITITIIYVIFKVILLGTNFSVEDLIFIIIGFLIAIFLIKERE